MKITLDPQGGFLKEDKKGYDKKNALIDAGVKAAVCFKDGDITPDMIRAQESDERLLERGLNTVLSDHTSPSEQPTVMLEIVGIPKILCMVLNNEHQYTADERSLRYTLVKESEYISEQEVTLYNKWLEKFINILSKEYYSFFLQHNKGTTDEITIKRANSAIKKIAQENARYMVSMFVPTTLTYSVPFAQINKLCVYMNDIVQDPHNEFECLLVPYFKEFIQKLKDLDVILTEHDAHILCPKLNVPDTDNFLYKNNKHIALSIFAERNKFSGIKLANEFGVSFSYNMDISAASLAQFHRHRTVNFEMLAPTTEENLFYIPKLLDGKDDLIHEWLVDINSVNKYYPSGKLLHVNANGPLKHLVNYVGKERACDRAFLETEDMFTNQMLPEIYEGLLSSGKQELAEELKPYVLKLRCMYPDYNCPSRCGHPRIKRNF